MIQCSEIHGADNFKDKPNFIKTSDGRNIELCLPRVLTVLLFRIFYLIPALRPSKAKVFVSSHIRTKNTTRQTFVARLNDQAMT